MTFAIHILLFHVLSFNFSNFLNAGVTAQRVSHTRRIDSPLNRRTVLPYAPDGLDTTVYKADLTTECSIPSISKTITVSSPTTVAAGETFDCQFAKYQHTDTSCDLETEKGNKYAVFLLEDGATLKNCFLGYSQESVHCKGSCTVENSHWLQLCDDGIMFHMDSGEATVSGCSFSNAGNKALQFNGGGTINVNDVCFYNVDIGYRSCGSGCRSSAARAVIFNNIELKGVNTLAGFNHADGDTVDIRSYSGKPAKVMCQDKEDTSSSVPAGCTIGGSSSSSDPSGSSTAPSNSSSTVPSTPSDDGSTTSGTGSKNKSETDKSKSSKDKSDPSTDPTDPSTEESNLSTEESDPSTKKSKSSTNKSSPDESSSSTQESGSSSDKTDDPTTKTKSNTKRSKSTKKKSKGSKPT